MDLKRLNISEKTLTALNKKHIFTVKDFLEFFPRKTIRYGMPVDIQQATESCAIIGRQVSVQKKRMATGKTYLVFYFKGSVDYKVVLFNNVFLLNMYLSFSGKDVVVCGEQKYDEYGYSIVNVTGIYLANQYQPHVHTVYGSLKDADENELKKMRENFMLMQPEIVEPHIVAGFMPYRIALQTLHEPQNKKAEQEAKKRILELNNKYEEQNKQKDYIYQELVKLKEEYNKKFLNILEYIKYIKLEEKRYIEAGIDETEKVKLFELEKILRTNKNKSDKMVEDIADLIKKQQKYAKIGAETNSKYSSLIDGFKIKQEAEKLKKILTDMYSEFKEYYFNKLNKKIPNLEYERKLSKLLEIGEKVEVFLNYIYNPKNAKQRTDLNRFDELILIEENEIKRRITKEVDGIIANANLIIIDEEIDTIETKKVFEKLFDIIIGKRKKDKERVIKLEELAEEVDAKLRQSYTINRNYKIHDVLAKIMIFKSENIGDELVKDLVDKITIIEKAIAKNFVISEETVLKKIEELKMLKLPVVIDKDSENDIEYELALIRHKYEYDNIYDEEEVKYVDTTANEIKQIIEYIKLSI